jgi:tRNA nucleotidyltransferase (CCA-adding enzyme)
MSARWEHFEHSADVGVRGYGATPAEAFEQAALALTAVLVDPATLVPLERIVLHCTAPDRELLLATWLDAVIYEMAVRRVLFGRFEVNIDDGGLDASAWAEPVDRERHHPAVEVKGATLTALEVRELPDGSWIAQCVVDV